MLYNYDVKVSFMMMDAEEIRRMLEFGEKGICGGWWLGREIRIYLGIKKVRCIEKKRWGKGKMVFTSRKYLCEVKFESNR